MTPVHRALTDAADATQAVSVEAAALSDRPERDGTRLRALLEARDRAYLALGRELTAWTLLHPGADLGLALGLPPARSPAPPAPPAPRSVAPAPPAPAAPRPVAPAPHPAPRPVAPTPIAPAPVAPPPAPPAPPGPPARPATAEELAALSRHLTEGRATPSAPPSAPVPDPRLHERAIRFGPPTPLSSDAEALARLDGHLAALDTLDGWLTLDKTLQRGLLGYAVAQARYAQQALGGSSALPIKYNAVFGRYTSWSKEHQPGFVHGLMTLHAPRHGTWIADVRAIWLDELGLEPQHTPVRAPRFSLQDATAALADGVADDVLHQILIELLDHPGIEQDPLSRLVADHIPRLTHPKLKRLKKRAARVAKGRTAPLDPRSDLASFIPDDWPWRPLCVGQRAVMLGGDPRQTQEQRIQAAFQFDALSWESGWDNRRLESLSERIRAQNIDLVLIIQRFVNHSATNMVVPACKEASVPFVLVSGGYGVAQIRQAIETRLPMPDAARARPDPLG